MSICKRFSFLLVILTFCAPNDEVSRGALGPLERAQAIRLSNSLWEDSYFPLELERRAMSFERLTDAGPKGGKAAFKESPSEPMVKPQGDSLKPRSR